MKPTNLPFFSLSLSFLPSLWSTHHPVRCGSVRFPAYSLCSCTCTTPLQLVEQTYTMSSSSTPVSATATTIAIPKTTFISDDPVASRTSYLSTTSTSLIACIIPIIAMMYLVVLSWAYQYEKKSPKALNKTSGVWLQKYAPGMDSSS